MRIVSLIASATEIIHSLGLGECQVGRSHECDFPASALELPVCTTPAFDVDGNSRDIDSLVRSRLMQSVSIYNVDADLIEKLDATHIITQTQCKVCAVTLEDVERALHQQTSSRAKVIALEPNSLADILDDIHRVARACECPERGVALEETIRARMEAIRYNAHLAHRRPRVAAIEWLEPLMCAGNWVPELIRMANGDPVFGREGEHSPYILWEDVLLADPDIIIALPCGFSLAKTRTEMHWLAERPGFQKLRAVRTGEIYLCDGNQYMNRPGPRIVESLQIFAEILHPDLFARSLEHEGWERLSGSGKGLRD